MLGQRPNANDKRDAVHVAIIPAEAGEDLEPGSEVAKAGNVYFRVIRNGTGIVDPFNRCKTLKGELFWLCLFPNTVTGMRHHWQHPEFPESLNVDSEQWLRDFCERGNIPDYETIIGVLTGEYYDEWNSGRIDEDRFHFMGIDAYGDIPPEFWYHAKQVTGIDFENKPSRFSCSC